MDRLKKVCNLLEEKLGFYIPEDEVLKRLEPASKSFGFKTAMECVDWLVKESISKKQFDVLVSTLTIGETYFFRDDKMFQILKDHLLPELLERSSKSLRIWSAACCTGEEIYSIAILLKQLLPHPEGWSVKLVGSDINPAFLKKANSGIYKKWSFRSTPKKILETYFTAQSDGWFKVNDSIRSMVEFRHLNLIEDSFPFSEMDLILCNNVLIYFSPKQIQKVVHKLGKSLLKGGYFITSAIEVPYIQEPDLQRKSLEHRTLFKKELPAKQEKTPEIAPVSPPVKPKRTVKPLPPLLKRPKALSIKDYENNIEELANEGEILNALKLCDEALDHYSVEALFHYLKGVLYQELEQPDGAVKAMKEAIFLDPQFVVAHYTLGNLLIKQGDHKNGQRHLRNAQELLEQLKPNDPLKGADEMSAAQLKLMTEGIYDHSGDSKKEI